MKQENELLTQRVKRLMEHCETQDRGYLMGHELISEVSGEVYNGPQWGVMITKWRKTLLKTRNLALKNEHAHGYKLATVNEQLNDIPIEHQERAIKHQKRGKRVVSALPMELLSDHQMAVRAKRMEGLARVIKESKRELKEQRALFAPAESLPLRKLSNQ